MGVDPQVQREMLEEAVACCQGGSLASGLQKDFKINLRGKRLQHEMISDQPVLQQRGEQVREEERTEAITMQRPAAIWE